MNSLVFGLLVAVIYILLHVALMAINAEFAMGHAGIFLLAGVAGGIAHALDL
jgi:hypothetical protein